MPVSPPQVMAQILKDMGITEYEPRVINQMLEFAYSKRGRAESARGSRGWSREVLCGAGKCCVERGSVGWSREGLCGAGSALWVRVSAGAPLSDPVTVEIFSSCNSVTL